MKFTLPSDAYNSSKLTTRSTLKSRNTRFIPQPLKTLWLILFFIKETEKLKRNTGQQKVNKILDDMKGFKEQNTIIDSISQKFSC